MRLLGRLCVVGAVALTLAVIAPQTANADLCDNGAWLDSCGAQNKGDHVEVSGSTTKPGTGSTHGAQPGTPAAPPPPVNCDDGSTYGASCGWQVVMLPTVRAEDLASFRPAAPTLATEPGGLGVAGLPTNLVATASEQQLSGELLGYPVTVRFVPAGFVFDYGDGTTQRSTNGGASWRRLGQAQFTPTATSHAYRERGDYVAGVRVLYAASVDFGTGAWRPVIGDVTAATTGHGIRILDARTALVDRTCAESPTGPGC